MTSSSPFSALDPCVHCGFCLPACPTYLATGDEADSPRGRIVLMRALEHGEIAPDDTALLQHLDSCLGCRGCEPVCPAGVGYGKGLEAARDLLARHRGLRPLARLVLGVFARRWLWRPIFGFARWMRGLGMAKALAGRGSLGFSLGMVAASEPPPTDATLATGPSDSTEGKTTTVALFRGCVMDALFSHVHDATRRTLERNGYRVVEVTGQVCCGALHEHAGDRPGATALARTNVTAFLGTADVIAVNSAGCGALLKEYGHLLGTAEAADVGGRVRDVTELLAERGPLPGAPLDLDVAYDAPCHLQHAQRVQAAPLTVLRSIPGLRLQLLPGSDHCCGSAGIYSLLEPAMSRAVLDAKIAGIAEAAPRPTFIATGNPGCLMQIGAGLRAAGLPIRVVHPVELLDWSYGREDRS
ncbi:MAG: heterodisulfide reductase-related iron-sulfur binding cluster [Gemmatimonadales bacterium]